MEHRRLQPPKTLTYKAPAVTVSWYHSLTYKAQLLPWADIINLPHIRSWSCFNTFSGLRGGPKKQSSGQGTWERQIMNKIYLQLLYGHYIWWSHMIGNPDVKAQWNNTPLVGCCKPPVISSLLLSFSYYLWNAFWVHVIVQSRERVCQHSWLPREHRMWHWAPGMWAGSVAASVGCSSGFTATPTPKWRVAPWHLRVHQLPERTLAREVLYKFLCFLYF